MLYGKYIKEFKLFTFYKTANSIDFSAYQDTLMLTDIATYHQQLKNLWEIQPAHLEFTQTEIDKLNKREEITVFDTEDFRSRAKLLHKRGKELIEFYPKLVPDEFIRDPAEEAQEEAELENKTPLVQEPSDE